MDFLDGWLNLVEKLLNTQSIVDSPHTIVSTSASAATSRQVTFDAITFVMKAQQVSTKDNFYLYLTYAHMNALYVYAWSLHMCVVCVYCVYIYLCGVHVRYV